MSHGIDSSLVISVMDLAGGLYWYVGHNLGILKCIREDYNVYVSELKGLVIDANWGNNLTSWAADHDHFKTALLAGSSVLYLFIHPMAYMHLVVYIL